MRRATGEQAIVLLAVLTFLARWLLADWNSYWLDELLSVNVYGLWHDTTMEALRTLAEHSIHPPLFQFTLYQWMGIFGDSEVATRSLSNLYITLATVLLYFLVRDVWSRRIAFLSAAAFSVMHTPTYYGLETRSYAQTIFLVALSSYLLLRLLHETTETITFRRTEVWLPTVLLVGSNTSLLLTHYYNMFWLAAQAMFAVAYLMRERPRRRWPAASLWLTLSHGVPLLLFWVVWGGVFSRQLRESSGDWEIAADGPARNAVELLLDLVVTENIDPPAVVGWFGAAAVMVLGAWAITAVIRAHTSNTRREAWALLYLGAWLILPLVVVYVAFSVLGVERYSSRYFVFSVMPLAPLMIIVIEKTARLAALRMSDLVAPVATTVAAIAIVTLLVPLGHDAATQRKHDWRGIVQQVNDVVRADDESSYIIYETSHRRRPMTDYYFDKLPGRVGPHDTLQRAEEREGAYRMLDQDAEVIADHDYLIVMFTHSRTTHFPSALARLEEEYEVRHRQLNHMGRGFIIFDTAVETP